MGVLSTALCVRQQRLEHFWPPALPPFQLWATYAMRVSRTLRRPSRVGEPELQAVQGGLAGVFGELPAVLSAYRAEQSADMSLYPPPVLHAAKAGSSPQEEFFEFHVPGAAQVVAGEHPVHGPGRAAAADRHELARGRYGGTATGMLPP